MKHKIFSVTVVLMLLFQMIPFSTVLASEGRDIGAVGWVTIHGRDGTPQSTIEITDPNGEIYESVDGVYADIPAGAKIVLRYAFSLSDGDGNVMNEYSEGDYFTISLPKGLDFTSYTETIRGKYEENEEYNLASCSIEEGILKVVLTKEAADEKHKNKWGHINIEGTFLPLTQGDGNEETTVIFGEEEILIKREPLPMISTLSKSGRYDLNENVIIWTVTIEPPAGDPDLSYEGYTVVDSMSDNQKYVAGSFKVGDVLITDTDLDLTVDNAVSYTFSESVTANGDLVITYKTRPVDFSGSGGKSKFENTVNLKRGEDEAADPCYASVEHDWIDKKGSVAGDGGIVRWTVTVYIPGEGEAVLTNARIVDKINENFELLEGDGYPVTVILNVGEDACPVTGEPGAAGLYGYNENILTYSFPENQPMEGSKAVLEFYTRAKDKDNFLDDNGGIDFENTAYLIWGESTELDKFPSYGCEIKSGIGEGGLVNKNSENSGEQYLYIEKDIIKWTITVNRNKISMSGAVIEDEISEDQELLIDADHPFKVGGVTIADKKESMGNFIYIEGNTEKFTYSLGDISAACTIVYYTKITDHKSLYKNGNVSYNNKVKLNYNGKTIGDVTGTKVFKSRMLEKSVETAYDYNSHLVQWEIVVNRNMLPIKNAVVTDDLPDGMKLYIDDDHLFEISPSAISNTATDGGDTFEIKLPENTEDHYIIKFWSKLSDDELKEQWTGERIFKNEAVLKSDECEEKSSDSIKVENPIVFKDYVYAKGEDTIHWSIVINNAQMELQDAEITDELHGHLQLVEGSVMLYTIPIDSETGKPVKDGKEPVTEGFTVETDDNNRLIIGVPDGPFAYLIEFSTVILENSIDLKNKVTFSGKEGSPAGDSDSRNIKIVDLYSGGGSGSSAFTVHKYVLSIDGKKEPVSGVAFRLLNANKDPVKSGGKAIERTTDSSGEAVFENLPSWTFFIEEISTANGYLILDEPYFVGKPADGNFTIVEVENEKAVIDIPFRKTDKIGTPLTGGRFQLEGKDFAGEHIVFAVGSEQGIVTFKNVPIDDGEGYTISELSSPSGYKKTNDKLKVFVRYTDADQRSIEYIFEGEDVLYNERSRSGTNYGKILIYKTDAEGKGLTDAEFTLYDNEEKVMMRTVSDKNGFAEFSNVPAGSYAVLETLAPLGYFADESRRNITLKAGQTLSMTFINKIDEKAKTVEPVKPDDGEDVPDAPIPEGSAPGGIISDGTKLPKTGDSSLLFLWFMTMFAALSTVHFLIRDIRSNSK